MGYQAPAADCPLCPRLVGYRDRNRTANPDWFNGAVPSFGSLDARFLVVGLAPGVRGANRTGRPFTGDFAGVLLYQTLDKIRVRRGGSIGADPADGIGTAGLSGDQRGALRAAGQLADAGGDHGLQRVSGAGVGGDAAAARGPGARRGVAQGGAAGAWTAGEPRGVRSWRVCTGCRTGCNWWTATMCPD